MYSRPRSTGPRDTRIRSRMLALGLAAALAAPLGIAAVAPAQAFGSQSVPINAGAFSSASTEVDGVTVDVTYSAVPDAGFVDVDVHAHDVNAYAPVPAGVHSLAVVRAILRGTDGTMQNVADLQVTTCVDLAALAPAPAGEIAAWVMRDTEWDWIPAPTTPTGVATYCVESTSADSILLFTELITPDPPDVDVLVTRVFERLDIGLGDGEQNGVYLMLDAVNNGATPITLGLGADLRVEGVDEKLWLDSTWGFDAGTGFGDIFNHTIDPGQSVSLQMPDWPGKTYTFWSVNVDDPAQSVSLQTYVTGGLFNRVVPDLFNGVIEVGSAATFAGSAVFPGVTTTVEAAGLIPGETYDLWLTPGVDYFSFMLLGGLLADEAVQVGTATVDSSGRLATAFSVPSTAPVGARYQLMIGNPATRSWPAGTRERIEIVEPDSSGTVNGPATGQLEVSIPLDNFDVLFSFPAGTTNGQTTASASSTGPAAVGFTMPTNPPVYLHLSTTVAFTGTVEVCVGVPSGVIPTGLRLYHYALTGAGYAWVDITTRYKVAAVCGATNSFSPFALGVSNGVRLTSKEQCKSGGWMTSTLPVFRSHGACVKHFARRL